MEEFIHEFGRIIKIFPAELAIMATRAGMDLVFSLFGTFQSTPYQLQPTFLAALRRLTSSVEDMEVRFRPRQPATAMR